MIRKHSVSLNGHKTSFSLEDPFWDEFCAIAANSNRPLSSLLCDIDDAREHDTNLSSAIRLFVLQTLKEKARAH